MKTFPMFIKMTGKRVIICGGGEQAAQKCRLILKTEARIVVLADTLDPELLDLVNSGRINWQQGDIALSSFKDTALVFVATGSPVADVCLHALATQAGALVNVVDKMDLCDAITPSIVDRDPVVIAIGTEGNAPVLARQIKTKIEEILEPRLGALAELAGRLRPSAERLSPTQRRDLWRWVFSGPVRSLHARGAEREAATLLKDAVKKGAVPPAQPCPVSLVSAGPGELDMITLRGVKRLQEADVIFHDPEVASGMLELARRDAERVSIGSLQACENWPQDRLLSRVASDAKRGRRIAILLPGDVQGSAIWTKDIAVLRQMGIDVEIVPGAVQAGSEACALVQGGGRA
jgi:uroporphyrin-III C-methyltransferase/precorrin-2 dehydrogenase/sirohydrochlorin ferrochelatase